MVIHFARTAPAGASRWNIDIIDETSFADLHPANSENRLLVYFEDEHPIPIPIVVLPGGVNCLAPKFVSGSPLTGIYSAVVGSYQ